MAVSAPKKHHQTCPLRSQVHRFTKIIIKNCNERNNMHTQQNDPSAYIHHKSGGGGGERGRGGSGERGRGGSISCRKWMHHASEQRRVHTTGTTVQSRYLWQLLIEQLVFWLLNVRATSKCVSRMKDRYHCTIMLPLGSTDWTADLLVSNRSSKHPSVSQEQMTGTTVQSSCLIEQLVFWLLTVLATSQCISGMNLLSLLVCWLLNIWATSQCVSRMSLLVACLLAQHPSNRPVYLWDGCAPTSLHPTTLR